VTIVFADLVGSTALQERLEPETTRRFMESYYAAMRGAVESHGGIVTQLLGDGVKAVFGIPRVAEDDAIRGVRYGGEFENVFITVSVADATCVRQYEILRAEDADYALAHFEELVGKSAGTQELA
jgi:class 3 adenylate cyclase